MADISRQKSQLPSVVAKFRDEQSSLKVESSQKSAGKVSQETEDTSQACLTSSVSKESEKETNDVERLDLNSKSSSKSNDTKRSELRDTRDTEPSSREDKENGNRRETKVPTAGENFQRPFQLSSDGEHSTEEIPISQDNLMQMQFSHTVKSSTKLEGVHHSLHPSLDSSDTQPLTSAGTSCQPAKIKDEESQRQEASANPGNRFEGHLDSRVKMPPDTDSVQHPVQSSSEANGTVRQPYKDKNEVSPNQDISANFRITVEGKSGGTVPRQQLPTPSYVQSKPSSSEPKEDMSSNQKTSYSDVLKKPEESGKLKESEQSR